MNTTHVKDFLSNTLKKKYNSINILLALIVFYYGYRKIKKYFLFIKYYNFVSSCKSNLMKICLRVPFLNIYLNKIINKSVEETIIVIKKDLNEPIEKSDLKTFDSMENTGLNINYISKLIEDYRKFENSIVKSDKISGTVYSLDDEHNTLVSKIFMNYFKTNPLHPDLFPFLRKMESSIVKMCIPLFNGDKDTVGCVSSGGTESIMLACLSYRENGRKNGINYPEIIAPITVHPAFDKACFYFNIKLVKVPVNNNDYPDLEYLEACINKNTVCIVGSAPGFPHGIVDPLEKLSKIALKNKLGFHVDSCLGGFLLPFMEEKIKFDFCIEGVTSISADLHKYGYCPKGVSVLLYKNKDFMHNQYFAFPDWPGGIYTTSTMLGSRPGNVLCLTYATLLYYGIDGYKKKTKDIIETTRYLCEEIKKIKGISIIGTPKVSVIGIFSEDFDIYEISDHMKKLGWNLNNLQFPSSVHLCVTDLHTKKEVKDTFIKDLKTSISKCNKNNNSNESASIYGSSQKVSNRGIIKNILHGYLDCTYS